VTESGAGSYGDAFADVYDRWYADVTDAAACVRRVADLAASTGSSAVLELGAGTGRLALPLSAAGLDVTALDASAAMLDALRTKPGAERLRVVEADMSRLGRSDLDAHAPADGYAVVLVAYNTLFNLPDEAAKRACVAGAAQRLADGGRLVVEAFVPVDEADRRRDLTVSRIEDDELVLTATIHDPAAQVITGQHVQITEQGIRLRPWRVHYLRPDQLDALAVSCGLTPLARWSDWDGAPYDDGPIHISVYGRTMRE
jgi:SAM-dependent methyltransferase